MQSLNKRKTVHAQKIITAELTLLKGKPPRLGVCPIIMTAVPKAQAKMSTAVDTVQLNLYDTRALPFFFFFKTEVYRHSCIYINVTQKILARSI